VSTLATTDPELIEIFDNFAFDEVLQGSTLDVRTRLMVQLAAIIASQANSRVPRDACSGTQCRRHAVEAKEIVSQAIPYAGLAKVFEFIHVTTRCSPSAE
jgi:4-carboxymuconolactone decarboxylase